MSVLTSAPTLMPAMQTASQAPSMVSRMTMIMEAFEPQDARLLLDEITVRAGLPQSTTHRILDQLVQLGWLEHAPDGYGMGWRSLKYRNNDSISSRIRAEAAPLLHDLQIRTGKVVHLAVLEGANIRYLDKLGGPTAVTIPSRVGGVNPAHGTALGKSMLAWMDPEDLDEIFASGLPGVTGKTLTDSALLYSELARIRRRGGLAYETGESYEGITCVASAIRIRRKPVAALSLVGRGRDSMELVAPLVQQAAHRISEALSAPASMTA